MFKMNQYFDGQVVSIGFQTETLPATVGVMAAGEYQFSTDKKETMTVISGALSIKLPNTDNWHTFNQGESFVVKANKTFGVKVNSDTAYLCTYE